MYVYPVGLGTPVLRRSLSYFVIRCQRKFSCSCPVCCKLIEQKYFSHRNLNAKLIFCNIQEDCSSWNIVADEWLTYTDLLLYLIPYLLVGVSASSTNFWKSFLLTLLTYPHLFCWSAAFAFVLLKHNLCFSSHTHTCIKWTVYFLLSPANSFD